MQLAAEENLFNQRSYRCTRILKTARPLMVFMTLAVTLPIYAQGDSPVQLRQYIGQQVGGIDKLQVPAKDADVPVPRQPDGSVNPRFKTTEAKRFLGKLLFHDPVRTARININTGQPLDLPVGTAFGGTVSASDPNIQAIVNAQRCQRQIEMSPFERAAQEGMLG